MDDLRVIILCKAPVPGRVKTRLLTRYSAAQAARLHAAMARTVIERASALCSDVRIAADDPSDPFFAAFGLPLLAQGEGDLGQRMARLARQAFQLGTKPLMFLGTDSPHMPASRLMEAGRALEEHDVVFGPVEDGGYDLVAMKRELPIFDDVPWSTAAVLRQSLRHCEALELRVACLAESFDIDTPADLDRAMALGWAMPR